MQLHDDVQHLEFVETQGKSRKEQEILIRREQRIMQVRHRKRHQKCPRVMHEIPGTLEEKPKCKKQRQRFQAHWALIRLTAPHQPDDTRHVYFNCPAVHKIWLDATEILRRLLGSRTFQIDCPILEIILAFPDLRSRLPKAL
jgi:hypothetical protein